LNENAYIHSVKLKFIQTPSTFITLSQFRKW